LPPIATCVPQIGLSRTTRVLATTDHTCRDYSNPSPNQKRNLKPTVSTGAYSASPSQLTLSTDQLSSNALNQNPYQPYGYGHDPSAFTFQPQQQPQQQYRQHHIPQTLKTDYHPQQLQQQQHQLPSPTNLRKRRISELGNEPIPGSSNTPLGGYGDPHGPFSAMPGGQVDMGLPSAQTLPSPLPKKGRTNTPWTPAEEQRLKTLRDAGSSWSEIAKTFPLRTEGSVKKHWYKVRVRSLRSRCLLTCAGRMSAFLVAPLNQFFEETYAYTICSPPSRICTTPSSRKTRSAISSASHTRDRRRKNADNRSRAPL
jgi:hypothetical protein